MSGRSEREKRRQERLESEQSDASSNRNRLIFGYAIASTAVLAVVVLVIVLATGGDDAGAEGDSHINLNEAIGSTNGVRPDNRAGTPPPRSQWKSRTSTSRRRRNRPAANCGWG